MVKGIKPLQKGRKIYTAESSEDTTFSMTQSWQGYFNKKFITIQCPFQKLTNKPHSIQGSEVTQEFTFLCNILLFKQRLYLETTFTPIMLYINTCFHFWDQNGSEYFLFIIICLKWHKRICCISWRELYLLFYSVDGNLPYVAILKDTSKIFIILATS